MKMLTNWLNKIVQIKVMERDQIHAFGWRKIRRMVKEKNKAVIPRLVFFFFP